jgi:hypothetical protein
MLDPWIIEEIRRREEQQRQRDERLPAVIEMPIHGPKGREERGERGTDREDPPRGVAIIDLLGEP